MLTVGVRVTEDTVGKDEGAEDTEEEIEGKEAGIKA